MTSDPSRDAHASHARWGLALLGVLAGASQGCNTLDDPPEKPGVRRIVETDTRPVQKSAQKPPPVQGGSLLALRDGSTAIVGDADRHRLLGVSVRSDPRVLFELPLDDTDQPGRMVEDTEGHVHVVLRGSGQLLELDPTTGDELARHAVCSEPRGIAYLADHDQLLLACSGGELWRLDAADGSKQDALFVAPDLRDVVPAEPGHVWVSTFRSAEVFHVSLEHGVDFRRRLAGMLTDDFIEMETDFGFETVIRTTSQVSHAAWRMVSAPDGSAVVVHQRASEEEIEIDPHTEEDSDVVENSEELLDAMFGNSYGGGGGGAAEGLPEASGCGSIVTSAVTFVAPDGHQRSTVTLGGALLPVDVALAPSAQEFVVASAGMADAAAPKARVEFPEFEHGGGGPTVDVLDNGLRGPSSVRRVSAFGLEELEDAPEASSEPVVHDFGGCHSSPSDFLVEAPATAVAFTPDATLLVYTREPAQLHIGGVDVVDLGGASVADTGHELFHRDSGGGIACASCHMEGTEDGHVWRFSGLGERRTQPLDVELRGTQPFHWDGTLKNLDVLMTQVFVGRMGGAPQSGDRLKALEDWLLDLTPPAPLRDASDPDATRGAALFASKEVGCASCHSGPKFTNNESVDVGTSNGVLLQVPSLRGIGRRAPLMHDGCARDLAGRFRPGCGGGDAHGHTSQLSEDELHDLVAYLETL